MIEPGVRKECVFVKRWDARVAETTNRRHEIAEDIY
jgi:hypothetical protein